MNKPFIINSLPVLAASAVLFSATPALADGVAAGTLIENTATATYDSAGSSRSVDSNTVTIRVDELLDVAVASLDSGPVTLSSSAVLSFSVTNTGNGPESFVLTAQPAVTGNDFDAIVVNLALDTNGNGVYDAGVDTIVANGATSPSIDADGAITVFVLVDAPSGISDAAASQLQLLGAASTGTGAPGTVFAGAGEGGSDAVVGSSGADDDALGSLIASQASVTLTKSAKITDPFGGSEPVPGATITYTIVAKVTGSGSVAGLAVNDRYPAGTAYVPGTLRLGAAALTDASDSDAGSADATGIAVKLGTVAAGANRTVKFDVVID